MIYIAKMHTNYPDFHGKGYYNFLMEQSQESLDYKIEDNNHDFHLENTVTTRFATVQNLLKKYPTKEKLNEALFT